MKLEGFSDFSLVGSGGNAHVWRATPDDKSNPVAIKVMRGGADKAVARRFERERWLMGFLSEVHNVVPVLKSDWTEAGDPYLIMPLYSNGSLQVRVDEGPLPWQEAVDLVLPITRAIAKAHDERVLHLDIKPANILLDDDGTPFLSDFGIAEMMGSTASMSAAMMTPAYTAPERLTDKKPTERSDIYGLGATLFALVAGASPFTQEHSSNPAAVITSVLHDPVNVADLPDDVPESVRNAILHAMAKKPKMRPDTASDFADLLEQALAGAIVPEPVDNVADTVEPKLIHQVVIDPEEEEENEQRALMMFVAAVAAVILFGALVTASSLINQRLNGTDNDTDGVASASLDQLELDEGAVLASDEQSQDTSQDPFGFEASAGPDGAPSGGSVSRGADERATNGLSNDEATNTQAGDDPAAVSQPASQTDDDQPVAVVISLDDNSLEGNESEAQNQNTVLSLPNLTPNAAGEQQDQQGTADTATLAPSTPPTAIIPANNTPTNNPPAANTANNTAADNTPTNDTTEVEEEPPVAAPRAGITAVLTTATEGTTLRFTSASSGEIDSLNWTFGDGATATGTSVANVYDNPGTYTVRLTARGPGGTDTATRTITINAEVLAPNAPPVPDNEGCQYLGNDVDVQWVFSPLPALVDTYLVEFRNGSQRDVGRQPGPLNTTDNNLRRIIAVKDGVQSALTVGSCEDHGGVKPVAGAPGLPTGVKCRFHDFFYNASGQYTWSETWTWTGGANTDSYVMRINQDGTFLWVDNGASTTHTTVGVTGPQNTGRQLKGIIAVGPGGETELSTANCGAMDSSGWENP